MFNSFCGGMGVAGWVVMVLFWGTFIGLAVWAISRLVVSPRAVDEPTPRDLIDMQLAAGDIEPETYQRLRDEMTVGR